MKNIQNLTIDINKKPFQTITANVGEVASRFIRITILENNMPANLTGVTAYLYAKKADGTKVFNSVKIEDVKQGIILAELTSQVLAVAGLVKLTLLLVKDNAKLYTKQFLLKVDDSIIDDEAIESSNEFGALTESLFKVDEWNGYFEETSGKIEEKYTERLNNINLQLDQSIYFVTPEMFGYVDGEDSTESLNEAISYCRTNGTKLICKNITLFSNIDFRRVKLEITGTLNLGDHVCRLGNNSAYALGPTQTIYNVTQNTDDYQLKVLGAKGQTITIGSCPRIKFELGTEATVNSIAYSTFNIGTCNSILIGNVDGVTEGTLWCNENTFNLKRCSGFYMTGSYNHNNNIINGGCFEGNSVINIKKGVNNTFRDIRFEGTPSVIFESGVTHNYIFTSWINSHRKGTVQVTNDGTDNKVIYTNIEPRFKHYKIDTIDYSDNHFVCNYNEETSLLTTSAWKKIFTSGIMEFNSGMTFFSNITGCDCGGRFLYYVYDENLNKLDDVEVECCSMNGVGYILPNIALPQTNGFTSNAVETIACSDTRVKYIQFMLYSSTKMSYGALDVYIRPGHIKTYV